jgi:hypothetical protein
MESWKSKPVRELVLLQIGEREDGKGGEERRDRVDGSVADGIPDLR